MKTTLSLLLLTAFGLWAQPAPPIPAPGAALPGIAGPRTNSTVAPAAPGIVPVLPARPPGPDTAVTLPGRGGGGTGAPAADAATTTSTNEPVEMFSQAVGFVDFRAMDLPQFLDIYSQLVKRTVLRPAALPAGTITLSTRDNLTLQEGIQAMQTVLQLNGVTVANIGEKFLMVVPATEAGSLPIKPTETLLDTDRIGVGPYVKHFVQLKYVKPSSLIQLLQPMTKTPNAIQAVDDNLMLVLSDTTEHIARMMEMIEKIDVFLPVDYTNEVIFIKYAVAEDIASALNSLSGGGSSGTVGGGRSTTGGPSRGGSGFGGAGGVRTLGAQGGLGGSSYGSNPGMVSSPGTIGAMAGGATSPGATATRTASASGTFTDRLRSIVSPGGAGGGDIEILGKTKILADPRCNSLIVFATKQDMETIKHIISQLDVVLAQVMIEAAVIQVSLGSSSSFGINWLQNRPLSAGNGFFSGQGAVNAGGPALSGGSFANAVTSGASNAISGTLPGGFSALTSWGKNDDLSVTIQAVAGDNKAKVLQMPRVQTSNAKAASLFVGESRPYPTGSYYGGGAYGGYSSIQQMPIGVSLEITPLINVEGLVVLDIHVRIDSVSGTVDISNVGSVPITSSKEAFSNVAVRNRETIMLGGLIENDDSSSHSGVPFLKDIPLVGALFRSSTSNKARNEMIVLIRPTVLETPEIAAQNATAEQHRMPAVSRAQEEMKIDEERRIRQGEKQLEQLRNSKQMP